MSSVGAGTDEMREIINDFLIEADELVTSLDDNLIRLEKTPDDLTLLNEIFRAAHTIKGTSGFLGFEFITSLTHKMEDVFNKLRKKELPVSGEIMDVLLESLDLLKILLDDTARGRESAIDTLAVEDRLRAIVEGQKAKTMLMSPDETEPGKSEIPVQQTSFPEESSGSMPAKKVTGARNNEQTIRIEVSRLDNLMNLAGELVLARNALLQTIRFYTGEQENLKGRDELNRSAAQLDFITTEVQVAVMKMRMLPIGKIFARFPRMVRDLAREMGKKIELQISGEETELDKSVIDEIGDPLVHLIRNSCDHGIESPRDRLAQGKPETGKIIMGAVQEGSHIIITIEDDGKGMDVTAIRNRVIERGLATPEAMSDMSDREIFRFIFQPGFSTTEKVTDISGRGVGMDVVKTNIEKLKGVIDIDSSYGVGSRISIKLPLTLAIIQGLLVVSEGDTYAIPLVSVLEILRISEEKIGSVNRQEVITLRDGIVPIVNLHGLLNGSRYASNGNKKGYVIVVGLAEQRLGLIVDELLGQEEVVVKSMGNLLGATKGLAGATILGDGRVRLIIDPIGLFEMDEG